MEKITLEVKNIITFTKAAKLLGVSRVTIYNHIKAGHLHPIFIDHHRYLILSEVEQLADDIKKLNSK